MRSFLAGILVTVALFTVVAQLALPAYLESRVEERLEKGGGDAKVSLSAFPAFTLIGSRGGTFSAEGSNLEIDLNDRRDKPFERLDGFEEVDMRLDDVKAGPLQIDRFELTRTGRDREYDLTLTGTTTPRELASELGSAAGGPLGGLVGSLATGAFPDGGRTEIPLELDAKVQSRDGRVDTTRATGSVGGVPAGPLTEIVVSAVLDRL